MGLCNVCQFCGEYISSDEYKTEIELSIGDFKRHYYCCNHCAGAKRAAIVPLLEMRINYGENVQTETVDS